MSWVCLFYSITGWLQFHAEMIAGCKENILPIHSLNYSMNEYNLILKSSGSMRYFSKKSPNKRVNPRLFLAVSHFACVCIRWHCWALPLTIWHRDTWHVSDQWISEYVSIMYTRTVLFLYTQIAIIHVGKSIRRLCLSHASVCPLVVQNFALSILSCLTVIPQLTSPCGHTFCDSKTYFLSNRASFSLI